MVIGEKWFLVKTWFLVKIWFLVKTWFLVNTWFLLKTWFLVKTRFFGEKIVFGDNIIFGLKKCFLVKTLFLVKTCFLMKTWFWVITGILVIAYTRTRQNQQLTDLKLWSQQLQQQQQTTEFGLAIPHVEASLQDGLIKLIFSKKNPRDIVTDIVSTRDWDAVIERADRIIKTSSLLQIGTYIITLENSLIYNTFTG